MMNETKIAEPAAETRECIYCDAKFIPSWEAAEVCRPCVQAREEERALFEDESRHGDGCNPWCYCFS